MAELDVRVIPRARREGIAGERAGRLLIRLTAPPVDGAANLALRRLVARRAGVPARRVSVVRGQTSRDKVVCVEGLTDAELRASMAGKREWGGGHVLVRWSGELTEHRVGWNWRRAPLIRRAADDAGAR